MLCYVIYLPICCCYPTVLGGLILFRGQWIMLSSVRKCCDHLYPHPTASNSEGTLTLSLAYEILNLCKLDYNLHCYSWHWDSFNKFDKQRCFLIRSACWCPWPATSFLICKSLCITHLDTYLTLRLLTCCCRFLYSWFNDCPFTQHMVPEHPQSRKNCMQLQGSCDEWDGRNSFQSSLLYHWFNCF